jgi:hypothetical protein
MQRFIITLNLQHFRELLAHETDLAHRAVLQALIIEEQAKLDAVAAAEQCGADPDLAQNLAMPAKASDAPS